MSSQRRTGEPVTTTSAREWADYWVMWYGTGTQRKGIHLPSLESTFEDPETLCSSPEVDGEPVAKDLSVFPPGYDPDRICTDCRRQLALELDLDRGDRRVE